MLKTDSIHDACEAGDFEKVKDIIRRKPYININGYVNCTTPLEKASEHSDGKIFKFLLKMGARMSKGIYSSIFVASCDKGNTKIVKNIIKYCQIDSSPFKDKKSISSLKNPVPEINILSFNEICMGFAKVIDREWTDILELFFKYLDFNFHSHIFFNNFECACLIQKHECVKIFNKHFFTMKLEVEPAIYSACLYQCLLNNRTDMINEFFSCCDFNFHFDCFGITLAERVLFRKRGETRTLNLETISYFLEYYDINKIDENGDTILLKQARNGIFINHLTQDCIDFIMNKHDNTNKDSFGNDMNYYLSKR